MASVLNKDPVDYKKETDTFLNELKRFHASRGWSFHRPPRVCGKPIDLYLLYVLVTTRGGWEKVNDVNEWETLVPLFSVPACCVNAGLALKQLYLRYLDHYEKVHFHGEEYDSRHDDGSIVHDTASRQSRRHHIRAFNAIPMSYNHAQHSVSDSLRQSLGMSQLLDVHQYERLYLSLLSPLPNEQDFALNVCAVLSGECAPSPPPLAPAAPAAAGSPAGYATGTSCAGLRLAHHSRLLDALLAHAGVCSDDATRRYMLGVYARCRRYSAVHFWCDSVRDRRVLSLLSHHHHHHLCRRPHHHHRCCCTSSCPYPLPPAENNGGAASPPPPPLCHCTEETEVLSSACRGDGSHLWPNTHHHQQQDDSDSDSDVEWAGGRYRDCGEDGGGDGGEDSESGSLSLHCALGRQERAGHRVLQVLHIVRNLSFDGENVPLLAASGACVRLLLLALHCRWSQVASCARDALANVCAAVALPRLPAQLASLLLRWTCAAVAGDAADDRSQLLCALDVLAQLARGCDDNDALLVRQLTERRQWRRRGGGIVEALCALLTLKDIMLLLATLECALAVTSLGEAVCRAFAAQPGAVATVVALLSVEAQSYGAGACILMKVLQTQCTTAAAATTAAVAAAAAVVPAAAAAVVSPSSCAAAAAAAPTAVTACVVVGDGAAATRPGHSIGLAQSLLPTAAPPTGQAPPITGHTPPPLPPHSLGAVSVCVQTAPPTPPTTPLAAFPTVVSTGQQHTLSTASRVLPTGAATACAAAASPASTAVPSPAFSTVSSLKSVRMVSPAAAAAAGVSLNVVTTVTGTCSAKPLPPLVASATIAPHSVVAASPVASPLFPTPAPPVPVATASKQLLKATAAVTPASPNSRQIPMPLIQEQPINSLPKPMHGVSIVPNENNMWAVKWLQTVCEICPANSVEQTTLYKQYTASAMVQQWKGVISQGEFANCVKSVFGSAVTAVGRRPHSSENTSPSAMDYYFDGIRSRLQIVTTTVLPQQAAGVTTQPTTTSPSTTTPTSTFSSCSSSILKAQLSAAPRSSVAAAAAGGYAVLSASGKECSGDSQPLTSEPVSTATSHTIANCTRVTGQSPAVASAADDATGGGGSGGASSDLIKSLLANKVARSRQIRHQAVNGLDHSAAAGGGGGGDSSHMTCATAGFANTSLSVNTVTVNHNGTMTTTAAAAEADTAAAAAGGDGGVCDRLVAGAADSAMSGGGGGVWPAASGDNTHHHHHHNSNNGVFRGGGAAGGGTDLLASALNLAGLTDDLDSLGDDQQDEEGGGHTDHKLCDNGDSQLAAPGSCTQQQSHHSVTPPQQLQLQQVCLPSPTAAYKPADSHTDIGLHFKQQQQPQQQQYHHQQQQQQPQQQQYHHHQQQQQQLPPLSYVATKPSTAHSTQLTHQQSVAVSAATNCLRDVTQLPDAKLVNSVALPPPTPATPPAAAAPSQLVNRCSVPVVAPHLSPSLHKLAGHSVSEQHQQQQQQLVVHAAPAPAAAAAAVSVNSIPVQLVKRVADTVAGGDHKRLNIAQHHPSPATTARFVTAQSVPAAGGGGQVQHVVMLPHGSLGSMVLKLPVSLSSAAGHQQLVLPAGAGQLLMTSSGQLVLSQQSAQQLQLCSVSGSSVLLAQTPSSSSLASTATSAARTLIFLPPQQHQQQQGMVHPAGHMLVQVPRTLTSSALLRATLPSSLAVSRPASSIAPPPAPSPAVATVPSPAVAAPAVAVAAPSPAVGAVPPHQSRSSSTDSDKPAAAATPPPAAAAAPAVVCHKPLPPGLLCEWQGCLQGFPTAHAVYQHAIESHCPPGSDQIACLWHRCDRMPRKRYSMMTHLQDRHCTDSILRMMRARREQLATAGKSDIEVATPPAPHPGYANNAAMQAIRRHALAEASLAAATASSSCAAGDGQEREGPVTKSIRLTAALVLRNLALYSTQARRLLRCHEHWLLSLAVSDGESSRTVAQILAELGRQSDDAS